ncbi:uncharacterized protein [Parasteatoda tepidariorum]|uniref:uncharacterized protein n=1 Tax=Parasteatoda tepidariorum TaxID=114398 RepID=UPI0039BC598C
MCRATFSVGSGGRTAIADHILTIKHKEALAAKTKTKSVKQFFRKLEPSKEEFDLATYEGTLAFHTIRHNQSFRSMDCTSNLQKKFVDKKFSCARTKCEAIAVNVFSPWAFLELKKDLQSVQFVTISYDTSNHNHVKLLPILVRYFQWDCAKDPINNKLVSLNEIKGETVKILSSEILNALFEFQLKDKMAGLSADNTNTNFGGLLRRGTENVHTKLQTELGRDIFGFGCNAHIIHNGAKTAFDCLPVDIEVMVSKLFSYFKIYTVRIERLKEFCEYADQEYHKILGHIHVRWLTLLPAAERILKIYLSLKEFMLSEKKCPKILKNYFESETTELWLFFAHSHAAIFNQSILKIESDDKCVIESGAVVKDLIFKLKARKNAKFVPLVVKPELTKLIAENIITEDSYLETSKEFYEAAISYLEAWNDNNDDMSDLKCLLLDCKPSRSEFDEAVLSLSSKCAILNVNSDDLFDEFTYLEGYLDSKDDKWYQSVHITDKWREINNYFQKNNIPFTNIKRIVELAMCWPSSNAPVERVFSRINNYWTKEKSRMDVNTVKAVLSVLINFDFSCDIFSQLLEKNPEILKKIHSSEKYGV